MTFLRPNPLRGADHAHAMAAPWRWFARCFGAAAIAHLAGNPAGWRGDDFGGSVLLVVVSAALGVSAFALVIRPLRPILGLTALLVLFTLCLELPVSGNHWLLVGFVAVAVLVSLAMPDPWAWFSITSRWILLGFYSFAAFAKLNTGFLDPSVSCGVFYANQSLASFGLPTFKDESLLGAIAIAGPVLTELSVPVLLAFTRTRRIGVLLALVFHTIISLDFDQHFYDFTAALVMLLCLFLPDDTTSALEARAAQLSHMRVAALTVAVAVVVASLTPAIPPAVATVRVFGFGLWASVAIWLIVGVAQHGIGPSSVPLRLRGVPAWCLVTIVVLNGMTPYLEVKTAQGFNMYANLVTVAGESNHLVVRRTLHLSEVQDDLLDIVSSSAPELAAYAEVGYLVPERNLLDYLARHRDVSVVVRDENGERRLNSTDGVATPLVVRKFLAFRAVDAENPPRCQAAFLPAL